ncbi:hypothetical protein [Marinobacter sp.]|uniref:hypothetical protein n=1 Tax=Marinobacter sp. TaxID=50741 RepID=UPI000C97EAF0|nr:hypothetical protein [Marinobacter sp.]MAB50946.1 hypothetical protein [Marinobacter sp.]|tara:strand:- start:9449 stop:10402 length:954 start_codon:yes stop_codon:yes gene_type:complete
MNSLLNMKIVNDKPAPSEISELKSNVVVDEETQEEDPNFVYEEDEPNIKEVISELKSEEPKKKSLLNVVKKPPIVKEAIFDDKPKKKKWSEEKKKKKSKEPETNLEMGMTQEEIDSYAPEEGFKEESDDEPIIPETKDVGGLDQEPEPVVEPVVKKRKPKKPMTEEHKRKVQEGLKKARETRKRNAELRRQKGIKTKTELKKEKKQLQMKLLEQEHAELEKQKKQLKPEPEPEPEPVKSEPIPIEKPKRDYITREDLEQAQLNTLATYEMMRKKRKEEKRKQQAIKEYQDNLKETINNINQPNMGWLKGAKKYGRYL